MGFPSSCMADLKVQLSRWWWYDQCGLAWQVNKRLPCMQRPGNVFLVWPSGNSFLSFVPTEWWEHHSCLRCCNRHSREREHTWHMQDLASSPLLTSLTILGSRNRGQKQCRSWQCARVLISENCSCWLTMTSRPGTAEPFYHWVPLKQGSMDLDQFLRTFRPSHSAAADSSQNMYSTVPFKWENCCDFQNWSPLPRSKHLTKWNQNRPQRST